MVSSHMWLSAYSRKNTGQTGGELVRYFQRQGEFDPAQYLQRTGQWADKYADYVAGSVQNLPAWAGDDPGKFFAAARANESADRWYWGFQVEFSLPRELTHDQQMALREDFMAATMPYLPAMWVKHDKRLESGEMHPHIHILLSARQPDGIARDAVQTFKLWQREHPERGGAPRDLFWSKAQAPEQLRQALADVTNYHLERAGAEERLDIRSLRRQGSQRSAMRYGHEERPDEATRAREQAHAAAAWEHRKAFKEVGNIADISREEFVLLVRQWTREFEHEKALERATSAMVQEWEHREERRLRAAQQELEGQLHEVTRQGHRVHAHIMTLEGRAQAPPGGTSRARPRTPDRSRQVVHGLALDEEDHGGLQAPDLDRKRGRDGYSW